MSRDVAIVIVTFNSEQVLPGLLASLQLGLGTVQADVIVVDNGSSDRTCDIADHSEGCRLIRSTNLGYAAGINLGVSASDAQSFLVLNPDLVLHPESVRPLLRRLRQADVGIVAPTVLNPDGSLHLSLRREPTIGRALGLSGLRWPEVSEYVTDLVDYATPHSVDWALGAALLISRDCHEALGGWDESYFLYSEETDLCLRARELGWETWYEPESVVTHIGGQSGQSDRTHSMQILNRVRLYSRRHSPLKALCYFGLTVMSEITWIARGHTQSRASVRALLRRSARPAELQCGSSFIPR